MKHSGSRNTFVFLAITIGVGLAVALVVPQRAAANTVSNAFISGNGTIGNQDPTVQFSLDNGATWQHAYIIVANGHYNTITGTQWISVSPSGYGLLYTTMLYQTSFVLPAGATDPSFSIQVFADDQASVYLNGAFLGQQANMPTVSNPYPDFEFPTTVFSTNDASLFVEGSNVIEFVVYNGNNPTGLDYDGLVTYQTNGTGVACSTIPDLIAQVNALQLNAWGKNALILQLSLRGFVDEVRELERFGQLDSVTAQSLIQCADTLSPGSSTTRHGHDRR